MAYYDVTTREQFQSAKVVSAFTSKEFPTIEMIKKGTDSYEGMDDQLREFISKTGDNTFTMPTLPDETFAVTNQETFIIPAHFGLSGTHTGTIYTHATGFQMVKAMFNENIVKYETKFADNLLKVSRAIAQAMTTNILSIIDGCKTQILPINYAEDEGLIFAGSQLTVSRTAQEAKNFISIIKQLMKTNKITDVLQLLTSPGMTLTELSKENYGANNEKNIQELYPEMFVESDLTTVQRWVAYFFPKGTFAFIPNISMDNRTGTKTNDGWEWGMTGGTVPYVNDRLMTKYTSMAVDASGLSVNLTSYKTTALEMFGFAYKYCVLTPYNQDAANYMYPNLKVVGLKS
jgi:hypothetical protein